MKLIEFLGLDKLIKFGRIIKENKGVINSLSQLYRMDDLKSGTLVGVDKLGNKYYENNEYYIPRNRWVDYNKSRWLDYDATQITPEWHRWLHHMADEPPSTHPPEKRKWFMDYEENVSGNTEKMYVPYSTTRTKIQAWVPPKKSQSQS